MKKNDLLATWAIIKELGKLYKSKCKVCTKKCSPTGKGFTIHHIKYKRDAKGKRIENIYSDFILTNGTVDRLAYYTYLAPIVKEDPKRFAFVHNKCHYAVTKLNRWNLGNMRRLYLLASISETPEDLTPAKPK